MPRSIAAVSIANEYVVDGNAVNKLLETYQLDTRMLPGQVFDAVEKKLIKGMVDEIDKVKPQAVRFVNLEAIRTGPYEDFTYAICGGLAELIESLTAKKIVVNGTVEDPLSFPWNLVSKLDKNFKGTGQVPTSTGES
jgi:hypothetical protein